MNAPGAYVRCRDRFGRFDALARTLPAESLAVVDRRVARLHPHVVAAVGERCEVTPSERSKSLAVLAKVLSSARRLPRSGTLVAIGGGTVGDLATVAAHLIKRGVRLIHVPTTALAAVDSSLGGKGALHVGGIKNAAGVFHYPAECWLCPELFSSLSAAHWREGEIEALKMAACLAPALFRHWARRRPSFASWVKAARALKEEVCAADPYEKLGRREVLNFGHTFGHALESVSGFRLSHGDAVGLGMLCALDVGRCLGVTPESVAREVENGLPARRAHLVRWLGGVGRERIRSIVEADKKGPRMVLLCALGRAKLHEVTPREWFPLFAAWQKGRRP
ncbi:MAG: 3-dehydroquinate synthase [Myxococcota bacterium]